MNQLELVTGSEGKAMEQIDRWPVEIGGSDAPVYRPRRMGSLGLWRQDDWAIKAYGIQSRSLEEGAPLLHEDLVQTAHAHVMGMLPLTLEEGAFYKTGFAILHEGVLANWLLFQWWTHQDVWCQLLAYADCIAPLTFKHSTRPIRACVYETAIIWHEQSAWIRHALSGSPNRRGYLTDVMTAEFC